MIRFIKDRFLESFFDTVWLQPEYIEIEDTGDALSSNRVLHGLKRVPRGARIVNKVVAPGSASGGGSIPAGTIAYFGVSSAPTGWLLCDGSAVSRSTYADLFAEIGETFGAGDGATTFNVPDLRGRAPVGTGTGGGLTARTLAATGGEEDHQLTVAELAAHTHTYDRINQQSGLGDDINLGTDWNLVTTNPNTGSTGGDDPHNTMQPFLVVTPCIAHEGAAGGSSSAYVPLDWHRLSTDPDWTRRDLTLRFNLANARVLLEVF
jgi:microcystin-dependent protein